MNKAKELLNKLKEFVSLHKVVCLSAAGVVCAVAVTGIVVAVVLGNHSKADTVAGVETAQEETMQTIVMATVEEVTEETTAQTEAEEETETEVIETDSSLEFEYDGKKIVISADKPVELIPEEDLADKIKEDDSTTEIGGDVEVDEPDSGNSKVNDTAKDYDIIVDNPDKTVTAGGEYAPLAGVRIDDLYNSSAPIGFTITDEAGNVVASMTGDEVKNYDGNPEDIKVTLENAGNYKVHYEYTAPGMTVTETVNGIDVENVKKTAIERGVITPEQGDNMSEKDIINLLFHAGFSTSKKITDVSGRGVGLDVVKSKIESLSGEVEVKSKLGEGSTWIIRLPLTLAIIQALMVTVGGEKYAISLGSIQTIEDIKPEEIKLVQNSEVINLRGTVIPIIRLSNVLEIESLKKPDENMVVVIVKKGEKLAGLVVDELMGQQEIVIKSLGKYINKCKFISGATILGDGEIALILDANALF